jgi:hypothetical protein
MNTKLSPKVVERAIADDAIAAHVEYCGGTGLFREDVAAFIDPATVEALVVKGRDCLPPRPGTQYAAFADVSGGKSDDAALAIAHREGPIVVLDVLERYPAPHNPLEIVSQMAETLRRYGLDEASGDRYAAEWTRMTFREYGIEYNRRLLSEWKTGAEHKHPVAKAKSDLYGELLPRLNAGEVELLDHDILVNQLCLLQRRTRSGGRDTIDHHLSRPENREWHRHAVCLREGRNHLRLSRGK